MKVIFVATMAAGHIKEFHIPYLKWFREQGWEVHVATYDDVDIPYCDKKHNIIIQRSPFKLRNVQAYFQLKAIFKNEKYDIIHGHTPMGGILARLCGKTYRRNGTKVLYTAHGFHFYQGAPVFNWLVYYPIEKWLSRYTDVLITLNGEDYNLARTKMKAKDTRYISGIGVDTARFANPTVDRESKRRELGVPLDATVVISVGELTKRKNHRTAIKAISGIKMDRMNKLYYIICGEGALKDDLLKLCKDLKIENRVFLLGYRNDMEDLLHMADIFLFPSLQEGLSVALMEAMAAGLPCVVSDIRGNEDLIEHGRGGFLCGASNEGEYAMAVAEIAADSHVKHTMGDHNKKIISEFDLANSMKMMVKIYLMAIS